MTSSPWDADLQFRLISERFEGFFSTTTNQQVTASLVSGFLEQSVGFLGNVGIKAGMEAGLLDRVWSLEELVGLLDRSDVSIAAKLRNLPCWTSWPWLLQP
jgi:hypothetical protein